MEEPAVFQTDLDSIRLLTIANPKRRNALQPAMRSEMRRLVDKACADTHVRVIIIKGEGEDFCAGADLSTVQYEDEPSTIELTERIRAAQGLVRSVASSSKPVIAAVEGVAFGSGMSLALACDFIVVARGSRFGANFVKIGIMAEFGLYATLPRRVGQQIAKRILMFGQTISGEEAYEIGMAEKIVEDGETVSAAVTMARELAILPPSALAATKKALASSIDTIEAALSLELQVMPFLARSDEFKAAVEARRKR